MINGLINREDHIILDGLAHACLQSGAFASTPNIHITGHLKNKSVLHLLKKIRRKDTQNAIMVITEGLYSMDSDMPDINELQQFCHEYNATLVLDVAHDLGSLGPTGRGAMEIQNLLGKVDIIMGSFSKTFCSNGGFVATNAPHLIEVYCSPFTFTNALSPSQASVILKAFEIVESQKGNDLRRINYENSVFFRQCFEKYGMFVYGEPSNLVPVHLGSEPTARITAKLLPQKNIITNLVEYPAVPKGAARLGLQLQPTHSRDELAKAANDINNAWQESQFHLGEETK